ncbi:hypothetical protein [Arachidicoccus soli]|uniref:Thioredoxin domain-containing protein n=1 Tax=Arachidicoccus soli TaxID=2341117 RepID=A0A386HP17_9BACT|nr:hypothetical protein [Arachidicoccus soli]AYD47191.1 hypothetical protein D6B99_05940 [Arachidicoccus soli]
MRKLFVLAFLLLGVSMSSFAQQTNTKLIAFMNKASWCPVCQANGPRFMKDIMPMAMMNKQVQVVVSDLSNDRTKTASLPMLEKAGIADFAKANKETGELYFLNAQSKQLISKISIAESDMKIKQAFKAALMSADGNKMMNN